MIFSISLATAGIIGFIALSYEILWYRAISIAGSSSPAAFGFLLGFYLAGLAIGAYAVRIVCDQHRTRGEPRYLRCAAALVTVAGATSFAVLPFLAWMAARGAPATGFLAVALSAALLGAVLPLLSHFAIAPDRAAGRRLSYLYTSNIAGSVLGSFLTGFVLLDVWRVQDIAFGLMVLGCTTAGALLVPAGVRGSVLAAACALLLGMGLLVERSRPAAFDHFYEKLIYRARYRAESPFRHVIENRSGVIAVSQAGTVFGSGVYDGRIAIDLLQDPNQIVRAFALAALHPRPKRVLMIGLAGGAWAQVIVHHPAVESLRVVEINPGYVRLLRLYPVVASLLDNPKVVITIDDGRRWLTQHPKETFDAIVSNTSYHWRANATNLLSVEYVRLVASHLRPGGIYYFNTTDSPQALKTAMVTFPYGVRFRNFAAVSNAELTFDRDRFEDVLRQYRIDGKPVLNPGSPETAGRLAEVVGDSSVEARAAILARLDTATLVTDDNMVTEWYPTPE